MSVFKSDDDNFWDIARVISTTEEQIACCTEECLQIAVASWAPNQHPE